MGTPKTLLEAMTNAISENEHAIGGNIRMAALHMRDFIAHKFCVALYEAESDKERDRLIKLFKALTELGE